jgi:DNA-binding response OmpR family regulator
MLLEGAKWKQAFIKKRLRSRGLFVILVSDEREAISLLNSVKIDLVMANITVQEADCLELYARIVVDWNIPVVFFNWWKLIKFKREGCFENIHPIN